MGISERNLKSIPVKMTVFEGFFCLINKQNKKTKYFDLVK